MPAAAGVEGQGPWCAGTRVDFTERPAWGRSPRQSLEASKRHSAQWSSLILRGVGFSMPLCGSLQWLVTSLCSGFLSGMALLPGGPGSLDHHPPVHGDLQEPCISLTMSDGSEKIP